MSRLTRIALAVVSATTISAGAVLAWRWAYMRRGPTADEFRVCEAFLHGLSADSKMAVAIERTTSALSVGEVPSWIPTALRPDGRTPPSQFVNFCGTPCGYDFLWKNQREWILQPSPKLKFPFRILRVSEPPQRVSSSTGVVIRTTRPGFDLWHRHAVLQYSFDCSVRDENAALCVDFGSAYLLRIEGAWKLARHEDVTF